MDFRNLGTKGCRGVMPTASKFNVVTRFCKAETKPAFTVVGVMPATITGGLPKRRENGVSIWILPSLTQKVRKRKYTLLRSAYLVFTSEGAHFLIQDGSFLTPRTE